MPVRFVHNLRSGGVKNVRVTHKSAVKRQVKDRGAAAGTEAVRAKSRAASTTAIRLTRKAEAGLIA